MNIQQRAAAYASAFPDRPPLACNADWVTGTWCIGACYKNPNKLYGAYPYGYLERVHSMFPDARSVLHVFSGGLDVETAIASAWPQHLDLLQSYGRTWPRGLELELVDIHGSKEGRYPTWQGDVTAMPDEWAGRFDLILADPPYSPEDAEKYGVKMPLSTAVMRELHRVAAPGANLVWLDQKWPMHRKAQWRTWGHIGLVRSTNHRMRLVSIFQKEA